MSTRTDAPADEPVIETMHVYHAPRALLWRAMTEPARVREWWGGPGVTNPVCEMDLRPGGSWTHVMRFPNGREVRFRFLFLAVDAPARLVWRDVEHDKHADGLPPSVTTLTLEDVGDRTRLTMTARFDSFADRDAALAMGFARPIEASEDCLTAYLKTMIGE